LKVSPLSRDAAVRAVTGVRLLVCIVLLGGAVAAGCGSSDEPESTVAQTSTTTSTTAQTNTGAETNTAEELSGESELLKRMPQVPQATESTRPPESPGGAGGSAFLREVFSDVEAMWRREFEAAGSTYTPATLTIFHAEVHTACGTQSVNTGPFYCPADHGVYLDTRFFDALARTTGVKLGDFAQAYVVAHELGHHVQTLLGTLQRIRGSDESDPAGANARSVRLELQADCFAGLWKHSRYQRGRLTESDLADALRAAAVVGSDFQQLSATGTIRPEDWTHGSSRQRQQWLTIGFEQGRPASCDTFQQTNP
jgi:predicted metalloprotease